MGTFIFFIIFFAVILPRLRGEQGGKNSFYTYTPPRKESPADRFNIRRNRRTEYVYEPQEKDVPDMKPARRHSEKEYKDPLRKKMIQTMLVILGGGVGSALFGTMTLNALGEVIWDLTNGFFFPEDWVLAVLFGVGTFGAVKIVKHGMQAWNRMRRFRLYNAVIGDRRVCPVSDIARSSGRNKKEVFNDMQEMVRFGYFPMGFVDKESMNYYADNEAWREMHPDRAEEEDKPIGSPKKKKNKNPSRKKADAESANTTADCEETSQTQSEQEVSAVERYLEGLDKQIRQIKEQEIHSKAKRLYEHSCDILAWVQLHPECAEDVRRFCSYYLPTATKLLSTYNEVAPHADESRVAASIQDEVSKVLDTMIEAFRGLMDHLLQNTAVDMQAEISALETVLSQEGLMENGFTMPHPAAPDLKM